MLSTSTTVSTLSEFVNWVEAVGEQFTDSEGYASPWFRGAGDSKFRLTPGLYRSKEGLDQYSDDELRNEFTRKALPLVADRAPRDDWEWYFLMQHYRAPTRLLDWTDSALVALYFALTSWAPRQQPSQQPKPAVWALNPFKLNRRVSYGPIGADSQEARPYLPPMYSGKKIPRYPVAIDPTFTAQRMLVQHSHFTVHGSDIRGIDEMRHELGLKKDLLRAVIEVEDQEDVDYVRWHLALLGMTETAVFPDLEGLARELRLEYALDKTRAKAT